MKERDDKEIEMERNVDAELEDRPEALIVTEHRPDVMVIKDGFEH